MTDTTFDLIHQGYVHALQASSINSVEVMEELLHFLENSDIGEEDSTAMDYFIDKLSKGLAARRKTFQSTNLCVEILHTTMYIVAWLNENYKREIDANITARRKSLESELTKALELADHQNPMQIKDRFGIRFTLFNRKDSINRCCYLANKILNVLCSLNRRDRRDFLAYIEKLDNHTQHRIRELLKIPFVIEPVSRTDTKPFIASEYPEIELPTDRDRQLLKNFVGNMKFYFDPKWNGYQSLHFILGIDENSEVMPGFQIELQLRTWKMHLHAENNINASHDAHKEGVADYAKAFHLSDEELELADLNGFNSYKDTENDVDGIYFPKVFYNRRMNNISF